jgi:hypothetical protein
MQLTAELGDFPRTLDNEMSISDLSASDVICFRALSDALES